MHRLLLALAVTSVAATAHAAGDLDHLVFVPNRDSNDVSVIDTRTDTLTRRVAVGTNPHQVAISAELGLLVATNSGANTLSIVDLSGAAAPTQLALDKVPEHMELSPGGNVLAVGNIEAGTVSLIDLPNRREVHRVAGLDSPHNLTFTKDGAELYVANLGADRVSVIDVASGTLVKDIDLRQPRLVAGLNEPQDFQGVVNVTATPDGKLGFAAYGSGDGLAVLDLQKQEVVKTLTLGAMPWRAYGTADGRTMVVPNNGDETISLIDVATQSEVARVPGAADMTGVNMDAFATAAFTLSRAEHKVVVVDLDRHATVGEIALPGSPETGVTTTDGKKLYVAIGDTNQVAVIDTASRKLVRTIDDVGSFPWGVHMMGAANYCH
ncbi:MAG: beta-propeller fold lactonase family protein [Geminicoccaceae bacterium]